MSYFVKLAKEAVENYVKERKLKEPERSSSVRRGVFVTILKDNKLRGCVGTFLPTKEDIFKEIVSNAISAGIYDYRFGPIKESELPLLSYEVSIIGKPQMIPSKKYLDPNKYGVIVETSKLKRGLLLPNIEGVTDAQKQIEIALLKGGIREDEDYNLYRFKVKKYNE